MATKTKHKPIQTRTFAEMERVTKKRTETVYFPYQSDQNIAVRWNKTRQTFEYSDNFTAAYPSWSTADSYIFANPGEDSGVAMKRHLKNLMSLIKG